MASSASSYAVRTESRREGKWGGGNARTRRALHLKPRRGVGRRGDHGRGGFGLDSSSRESEGGAGGRLEKPKLTGGPALSAGRERGRGSRPAGPRPRKRGKKARIGKRMGRNRPEREKGEGMSFPFYFSNTFSKSISFSSNKFLSKRYFVFLTIITIKCISMYAAKILF